MPTTALEQEFDDACMESVKECRRLGYILASSSLRGRAYLANIIVIFVAVAFVFLFVFLVSLLSKDDIVGCRPITRV
jgi:hypothetical protein